MRDEDVGIRIGPLRLAGRLTIPAEPAGMVLFAHGSGSSRLSPRNQYVASQLDGSGFGTLLFDLLTPSEEGDRANVFDIPMLGDRLAAATAWMRSEHLAADLPIGYFGASTGAGAALVAAAREGSGVAAIVSRGGRPDLAGEHLTQVTAPTLLIVGSRDTVVADLNRQAEGQMRCECRLEIVEGATHLFEEPGTLEEVARLASEWFTRHF